MNFEFLIPRRPLSVQAKPKKLQAWKLFVRSEAAKNWIGSPLESDVRLTLVYLCDESPPDIDNIIKPIQDALIGVVFGDDSQIADVDSHRRFLDQSFDLTRLPVILLAGIATRQECVYVRIGKSLPLEDCL